MRNKVIYARKKTDLVRIVRYKPRIDICENENCERYINSEFIYKEINIKKIIKMKKKIKSHTWRKRLPYERYIKMKGQISSASLYTICTVFILQTALGVLICNIVRCCSEHIRAGQ